MNKIKAALLTCLSSLTLASQASVVPVGVQTDVTHSQVANWGWTECYRGAGNDYYSITSIKNQCQGSYVMLAVDTSRTADSYAVLAAAQRADVFFDTGVQSGYGNDVTHTANGSEWYFSENWSWGFAALGAHVELNSCDVNMSSYYASCWHTGGGNLSNGWAYHGTAGFRAIDTTANRVVLVSNGPQELPEPAGLALVSAALAALTLVSRRRGSKSA